MKIKNLPKTIYLQIGEDCDHDDWNKIYPSHEVSWCEDKINNNDIVYRLDKRRLDEPKARSNGNAGYKEPAEDTLLTECCKALGWQGGTIHQIKQILIKAKKVKQAYETMQMPQSDNDDVEKFKAAMAELIYVFHKY